MYHLTKRNKVLTAILTVGVLVVLLSACSKDESTGPIVTPGTAEQAVDALANAVDRGDRALVESLVAKKNGGGSDFVEMLLAEPAVTAECLRSRRFLETTPSFYLFEYECGGYTGTFRVYRYNESDGEYSDEGVARFGY